MPLTKKGRKILASMKKEYGSKKGKEVFYASQNKGTITGAHRRRKKKSSSHGHTTFGGYGKIQFD
jgi:hypothetical protein